MMRVEINMDDSIRGLVAKYSNEKGVTMPEAYKDLIIYGLVISEVDFPTFSPDVSINDDILEAAKLNEDEYEIVVSDGE
jgi:hypothetical protein